MAKFCIIFFIAFVLVQVTIAARLPRDTDTETKPEENPFANIGDAISSMVKTAFDPENLKKMGDAIVEFGKEVQSKAGEVVTNVSNSVKGTS